MTSKGGTTTDPTLRTSRLMYFKEQRENKTILVQFCSIQLQVTPGTPRLHVEDTGQKLLQTT